VSLRHVAASEIDLAHIVSLAFRLILTEPEIGATLHAMNSQPAQRTSLRLSEETFESIDRLRNLDGKVTRNAWLVQAIAEKIQRDDGKTSFEPNEAGRAGRRVFEFFAGGGMARAGLGDGWDCVFSNDFDQMKARAYRANWQDGRELLVKDVNEVTTRDLPGQADLVWASFPCQDLSLAGNYEGIRHRGNKEQTRSGTFWPFWKLMRKLKEEGRAPRVIVLENVYGALTSNDGKDFAAIGSAFSGAGYRFGAMVIDAKHFVPQSRPRVFVVGIHSEVTIPEGLVSAEPVLPWHPDRLCQAYAMLSKEARKRWIWWNLEKAKPREKNFVDLIEENPQGVRWNTPAETLDLIRMMSPLNLAKLESVKKSNKRMVGGVYRRTRLDETGKKIQRAEVRFDDIAGCLRTPAGGSSRQSILLVEGEKVRSRLLSPRETARLMGLPDSYVLPTNYNDAYHVSGDGVAVPVVRHLAEHLLERLILGSSKAVAMKSKRA